MLKADVAGKGIEMETKTTIVTCLVVCLVGTMCCRDAIAASKAHANIGSVSRNLGKDAAGKRVYLITVKTTQYGVQFFGTLKSAFEVTDSAGQKYYGTDTFKQQSGYKSRSECEWIIEVKTDEIDKPALTAYSLEYFAPDVPEPLDDKTNACKDAAELAARNKGSKALVVRGRSVSLVGGEN
ncbi:MAG: hypothetical protein V1873_01885 [Verrucomicrobiota bacterium]